MASVLNTIFVCGTIVTVAFFVLLAMPKSKLRAFLLQICNYMIAAGLALLVISPIDVIPDPFFPIGFVDDFGCIIAAISAIKSARRHRQDFKHLP